MERQFHRNESSWNVRSRGTKVPRERKFQGANVPRNESSTGAKVLSTDLQSCNRGIIVYVKDNINCKQILLNNSVTEYTLLELKLQTNKVVNTATLYRSPNSLQELFILFDEICKKNPVTNYL